MTKNNLAMNVFEAGYIYQVHWWWGAALAPFTLPVQCGINALSATPSVWKSQRQRGRTVSLHGKVSVILSVLPTLRHIAAYKTAFVPGSRDRRLPQLNCGDCVTGFRAKHLNSPCLCLFPLCCAVVVTVSGNLYWKKSLQRSALLPGLHWTASLNIL